MQQGYQRTNIVDTFVYVMNSFGVDLSGLIRIQTHMCPSASQEHSMIFPEQKAGSNSSAVLELEYQCVRFQAKLLNINKICIRYVL